MMSANRLEAPKRHARPLSVRSEADLRVVPTTARVAVLLNANAKRVNDRVRRKFAEIVPMADLYYSRSLDEAREHARSIVGKRYGTVVVGGGDGTITHTMNHLIEASHAFGRSHARHALPDIGILRLGTGNGLANLSGAGKPADDVARFVYGERSVARPIRLIEDVATGWVFPFASAGYDAQLLNDFVAMVEGATTPIGKMFAKSLGGYFYALGTRTIPAELTLDRARIRVVSTGRCSIVDPDTDEEIALAAGSTLYEGVARGVLVGSTPFYGFGLKVLPHAQRRADRFHVRVSAASIPFLLAHLPTLWNGELRSPHLVDFLCESVRIEASRPLPLQFAGDARGSVSRLDLRLSDRTFRLVEGTGRSLAAAA